MDRDREVVPAPDSEVIVGPDTTVVLPKPPRVISWQDAERDPDHQARFYTGHAACSCGWEGESWTSHYMEVTEKKEG